MTYRRKAFRILVLLSSESELQTLKGQKELKKELNYKKFKKFPEVRLRIVFLSFQMIPEILGCASVLAFIFWAVFVRKKNTKPNAKSPEKFRTNVPTRLDTVTDKRPHIIEKYFIMRFLYLRVVALFNKFNMKYFEEKKSRKIRTKKKYQKRFERGKERDDCKHLLETEFRESENRRKNGLDERMNSLSEKLNARKGQYNIYKLYKIIQSRLIIPKKC